MAGPFLYIILWCMELIQSPLPPFSYCTEQHCRVVLTHFGYFSFLTFPHNYLYLVSPITYIVTQKSLIWCTWRPSRAHIKSLSWGDVYSQLQYRSPSVCFTFQMMTWIRNYHHGRMLWCVYSAAEAALVWMGGAGTESFRILDSNPTNPSAYHSARRFLVLGAVFTEIRKIPWHASQQLTLSAETALIYKQQHEQQAKRTKSRFGANLRRQTNKILAER